MNDPRIPTIREMLRGSVGDWILATGAAIALLVVITATMELLR